MSVIETRTVLDEATMRFLGTDEPLIYMEVAFVSRPTCSDWCGKSGYEDWLHTYKCDAEWSVIIEKERDF